MALLTRRAKSKQHFINLYGEHAQRAHAGPQHTYERPMVEALLAGFWNAGVVVDELAPDPGMPKAKANPSRMGNSVVYMIDVGRALDRVDDDTRRLLYLRYAHGWTASAIAKRSGNAQQRVSEEIDAAVSRIELILNGNE